MSGTSTRGLSGWLTDLGRSEVARAACVGFLVSWAIGQLAGSVVTGLIMSAAGDVDELDDALRAVLAAVAGLAALLVCLVAAWIGGRTARRMTLEPALLPRVARAFAWTLGILGGASVLVYWFLLLRLELVTERLAKEGFSPSAPGVHSYVLMSALTLMAALAPFVGRAGVLREPRARRTRPRRVR
jgi:MFS family permease